MVMQRYRLTEVPNTGATSLVLVVNPKKLDLLFSVVAFPQQLQMLLKSAHILNYHLALDAKKDVPHSMQGLVVEGKLCVRLPHTKEEQVYMLGMSEVEVWEVSSDDYSCQIIESHGRVGVVGGSSEEKSTVQNLMSRLQSKQSLLSGAFLPLFRLPEISVSGISKKALFEELLERARERYVAMQAGKTLKQMSVLLSSFADYAQLSSSAREADVVETYRSADMQLLEQSYVSMHFSTQLFGYKVETLYSGVELLSGIINRIGQQSLPYTVYLVGGVGHAAYKVREYFSVIYPNIALQFVGVSSPGNTVDASAYKAIQLDINEKAPDFVFVSIGASESARFVGHLLHDSTNFGVAIALNSTFDYFTSPTAKRAGILPTVQNAFVELVSFLRLLGK